MKQLFKIEFSRAFKNKRMLIVLIIETALIIYDFISYGLDIKTKTIPFLIDNIATGKVDNIPGAFSIWIGLHYNQIRTILYSVLPILAAFPYGDSLYIDEEKHYYYNIITRTKKSNYYTVKLIVMFFSGGTCAVFPFLLDFLLSAMLLPFENVLVCLSRFMGDAFIFSEVFYSNPLLYCILYMCAIFGGFGLLNLFCYIGTYIFSNKYIVVISPFCLYFCSFIISNFVGDNYVSPWEYLRFNDVLKDDILKIVIQVVIYFFLIFGVYINRIRKKKDML
jgi:hypothetical protein